MVTLKRGLKVATLNLLIRLGFSGCRIS